MPTKNQVELEIVAGTKQATKSIDQFSKAATSSFDDASESAINFGSAIVVANQAVELAASAYNALAGTIKELVFSYAEFENKVREVNTLAADNENAIGIVERAANKLSVQFGQDALAQVEAYYQAVSSGAQIGAEATALLVEANKLSIGGVASLESAISGLTSVQNAFGRETVSVKDINNAFFVAVKQGITRVDLLADSIGQLAPTASQAGVKLQETFSAVSAITSVGVKTPEAVTQINAALKALFKPTDQLKSVFKELGIESAEAEIKQRGLIPVLKDISDAAGGSVEQIAQLTGRQEASKAIVTLTGAAYEKFRDTLQLMETDTTAASDAFEIQQQSLSSAINQLSANFDLLKRSVGKSLEPAARAVVKALNGVINTALEVGKVIGTVASAFGDLVSGGEKTKKVFNAFKTGNKELDDAREKLFQIRQQISDINKAQRERGVAGGGVLAILKRQLKEQKDIVKQAEATAKASKENKTTKEAEAKAQEGLAESSEKQKKTLFELIQLRKKALIPVNAIRTAVKNTGKTEIEQVEAVLAKRLESLEKAQSIGAIKAQEAADLEAKVRQDAADKIVKISDKVAERRKKAIGAVEDSLKNVGKTELEIIEENAKARLDAIDRAAKQEIISAEEAADLKEKLATQTAEKTKGISKESGKESGDAFIKLFSAALSGGLEGVGRTASTLLGAAIGGGIGGQVAGQLFDVLSQSEDDFKKFLNSLVDADFISNIIKNISTLIFDEGLLTRLAVNVTRAVVDATVEGFKSAASEVSALFVTGLTRDQRSTIKEGQREIEQLEVEAAERRRERVENVIKVSFGRVVEAEKAAATKAQSVRESIARSLRSKLEGIEAELAQALEMQRTQQRDAAVRLLQEQVDAESAILQKSVSEREAAEKKLLGLQEQLAKRDQDDQTRAIEEATRTEAELLERATAERNKLEEDAFDLQFQIRKAATEADRAELEKKLADTRDAIAAANSTLETLESEHTSKLAEVKAERGITEQLSLEQQIANAQAALATAQAAEVAAETAHSEALKAVETKKNEEIQVITQERIDTLVSASQTAKDQIIAIEVELADAQIAEQERVLEEARRQQEELKQVRAAAEALESITTDTRTRAAERKVETEADEGFFSGAKSFFGFANGGEVPQGFPNDSFPAALTSGENVLTTGLSEKLERFIDSAGAAASGGAQNLTVTLQVGEDELANAILNLDRQGFRTAS